MSPEIQAISDIVNSPGALSTVLIVVVIYLKRADDKKDKRNAELVVLMNQERTERIGVLERHVDDCNAQHRGAQGKIEDLLRQMAQLTRSSVPLLYLMWCARLC